ncbi:MAG TPA: transporter [Thermoanaerobaculia bacterium]|nr:transporter [Thermoanaerobaculia bacterium]
MKRALLALIVGACAIAAHAADDVPPIADNSFLVEEAYNQEPGVVQHISTFERAKGGEWAFSFTQEWPAPNLKHQLSYTLALENGGGRTGIGDTAIHYRYQLVGNGEARLAIAPRISLLLPTGDDDRGFGEGAASVQLMLPVSTMFTPTLAAHWNAGATFTPSHDAREWTAANSFVWLAHPRFNALVETVWTRAERDGTHENELVVSPGIRWSYNYASGLQIVPGIALPTPVGHDHGERSVFLYLSFEHPFRRTQ